MCISISQSFFSVERGLFIDSRNVTVPSNLFIIGDWIMGGYNKYFRSLQQTPHIERSAWNSWSAHSICTRGTQCAQHMWSARHIPGHARGVPSVCARVLPGMSVWCKAWTHGARRTRNAHSAWCKPSACSRARFASSTSNHGSACLGGASFSVYAPHQPGMCSSVHTPRCISGLHTPRSHTFVGMHVHLDIGCAYLEDALSLVHTP